MTGFVSLVGAGPGDPDLLTRLAVRRLEEADVVLHDALVPPEIVAIATRALKASVGKRAGRPSPSQESIHRLLVRCARRGRRVVRLKGGDPFLFGRGGEEALALAEAGVPFELVPGVSSALSAPALAGIPVTHRGLSSAVTVVSGHAEEAYAAVVDALPPGGSTLVVLMGFANRAAIAARLLARGWERRTPVALLFAASRADAVSWLGRLEELASVGAPPGAEDAPVTLVVGAVVSVATALGRDERAKEARAAREAGGIR